MRPIRTVASVVAVLAVASTAGAAPISFVLEDGVPGTGVRVDNDGVALSFTTQQAISVTDLSTDTDGDGAPDVLDAEPGNPAVGDADLDDDGVLDVMDADPGDPFVGDATDLLFGHISGDDGLGGLFAMSGVSAFGQFLSNFMWMQMLPTFPDNLSSFANPFDSANRLGTTDDDYPEASLFDSEGCGCGDGNPWLALAGTPGFLGGVFQTTDATFHQFWVELIVDVADGTLTLLSAGYDSDVFAPVDDPVLEPVPEPATLSLFVLGTAGLVVLHKRRRR